LKHIIPKWGKCLSGTFSPKNNTKYNGKYPIIYRSSLELRFMKICDSSPSVLSWSSESYIVNYVSPKDGKSHRYYPDFVIKAKNADNYVENIVIEIKPDSQTRAPIPPSNISKKGLINYNKKVLDWYINKAKWEAAKRESSLNGSKFMIITEKWLNNTN